ncbi:MAG TPA: alpha/beta hydrolase, partial [Gammaproteobacteria bacterium]|nr:alpha/beta hydrolase [Gammaproteobacteria bacterium]
TYVPFLVPVFDETGSELQRRVYRQMKQDNPGQQYDKPEPIYRWAYRPEFQFSNYQLTMKEIRAENYAADGSLQGSSDILNIETPVLSSDNLLSLLYSLETTDLLPLDYLNAGPEKELIFTLGEQEIKATLGADQTLRFDDLSHLNSLDPEDYLTLRLYANNDMGNVLWEWAFGRIDIRTDLNRDGKVSIVGESVSDAKDSDSNNKDPGRPFRFWLNNDYDVVLLKDTPVTVSKHCPSGGSLQICEQEDVMSSSEVNSGNTIIESERDLEDFAPLALNLGGYADGGFPFGKYRLTIKAHGFTINLFQGVWEEGDEYVWDSDVAIEQASAKFIATLTDDVDVEINPALYQLMAFDERGIAKLIFEGVSGRSTCVESQDSCYLELSVIDKSNSQKMASSRIFMDFHDIKDFYDHYTSGLGMDVAPASWGLIGSPGTRTDIFPKDDPNEKVDYVMFVHGWRMQYAERVSFAETTLKRLYWSGYKGRFGAYTWPTTWFYKPAYVGTLDTLTYVLEDLTSYSRGEKIARQTGGFLADNLSYLKPKYKSLQVIAHSMGNVVVSEALKVMQAGVIDSYIATQAATSAGGYHTAEGDMNVVFGGAADDDVSTDGFWAWLAGGLCVPLANLAFEDAWRCASIVEDGFFDSDYDIPPDHYRYTINTEEHGLPPDGIGITSSPYYAGIGAKTDIYNFFNPVDSALEGWRLQQVTKPDSGQTVSDASNPTSGWFYLAEKADENQPDTAPVRDIYRRDGTPLNWSDQDDKFEIMASIVPSRSGPLGQKEVCTVGEISRTCIDLENVFGFTKSNYDHSAQWLNAYHKRFEYWETVCATFFSEDDACIKR